MENRKLLYLINPISGTRGKTSMQEMIRQKTQEKGITFEILPTKADGNYSFLTPVIEKQGVTDIIVCGGDGTVHSSVVAPSPQ